MPCGFAHGAVPSRHAGVDRAPDWPRLRAVQNRPGLPGRRQPVLQPARPALVESLEILAEILHPDVFRFGHEGTGWQPF